ncbi:MAG TPA: dUTP diphosphatase [Patescibacteria group bacterium]|nr:dUTP diphosphatase [Patescibacteria group bacterium]
MELRVTRVDKSLPLPKYETPGACAFDVFARETTVVAPKSLGFIPTGLVVCVPEGHTLLLASRSSTPKKKGLLIPHGIGIVDQDYCGPDDEMKVQVWNFTDAPVTVERGERVAQAMLVPIVRCALVDVAPRADKSRGGFGSTG